MNDQQWKDFFKVCANVLGKGNACSSISESWCSWTTFQRLEEDSGYWTSGLPNKNETGNESIQDGGAWGQPFLYEQLAHIIVPKYFIWEVHLDSEFTHGQKEQDLEALSKELDRNNIVHRKTSRVVEIKLY